MRRLDYCNGGFAVRRVVASMRMRALGIDYGRKRIGLALSDPTGLLARAWKTIASTGLEHQVVELASEIEALRSEPDGLSMIVIGLPRRLSGEPHEQTALVRDLAARLAALTPLPIVLQDERLSSHEAEERLARRERDWRKRKPLLDAAAAAVILQDYLDTQPRHNAEP
jgi:putative holliday junction resolvase